jgi:hypothetical protein
MLLLTMNKTPNQSLAVVKSAFNFMKPFSIFATLAAISGASAPSR